MYAKVGEVRIPLSSLSCVHFALGQLEWHLQYSREGEQWNEWSNRPLLIKTLRHILP